MCGKLIEDLESVICAYENANKGRVIRPKAVKLSKDEIDAQLLDNVVTNRFFYGILSLGKTTTMDIVLENSSKFALAENTQIIEVIQGVENITGSNYYFRGWMFTIQ